MDYKDPINGMISSKQSKKVTDSMEYSRPKLINLNRMKSAFGQVPSCTSGTLPQTGACNAGYGGAAECVEGSSPVQGCTPGLFP